MDDNDAKAKGGVPEKVGRARREVVELVLHDMGNDSIQWVRQWADAWGQKNGSSGRLYQGANQLHLSATARRRGYEDNRWMTFKQAKDAGLRVRKGAQSAIVEKWKRFSFAKEATDEKTGETVREQMSFLKCVGWWNVFNGEEIEGMPAAQNALREHGSDSALVLADELIGSSRCPIAEKKTDSACYRPLLDIMEMPLRGQFGSGEGFLRVLLHEMTHSTMVPLHRDAGGFFGTPKYAFEELVAELGSLYTAQAAGFDCVGVTAADPGASHYENHVAYLKSWLSSLKDDPDQLFRAASKASAAADYLIERLEASRTGKVA